MRYIVSLAVENHNQERLRAFKSAGAARNYVEKLGERLFNLAEAGKTDLFVSSATLYYVSSNGTLKVVGRFDGWDRGDGYWGGWQ
jgi:hypothetical protein